MLIRHADPSADGATCAAIYAPAVADSATSFEEHPPSATEMIRRIQSSTQRYPWLVAESAGETVGFAYATGHRERAAYRWTVETSVYIAAEQHRRGVGRALYGALLPLLAEQGLHWALAGITLPNPASIGLHEALGFEPIGVYREIGFKRGDWRSVGWWQARLTRFAPGTAPPEPGPPARLPG